MWTPRLPENSLRRNSAVFTVVGAGIIGLLTAHELADRGYPVTIVAKDGLPDEHTYSVSSVAVAQFLPWLPESHEKTMRESLGDLEWLVSTSRDFYRRLSEHPGTGIMPARNLELVGPEGWRPDLVEAMRATTTRLDQPIDVPGPAGWTYPTTTGYVFDTYSINTGKAIQYLAKLAQDKGVRFYNRTLRAADLAWLPGIVVVAAGDGARELTGNSDIEHFKGHTITLRPHHGYLPTEILSAYDLIMLPRDDGTIRLGAPYCAPGVPRPLAGEAAELLTRLDELFHRTAHLVAGLRPNLLQNCDILYHSAGHRVSLTSGHIHVKRDPILSNVLHANGFLGMGWSVGPAYAKLIANQAIALGEGITAPLGAAATSLDR